MATRVYFDACCLNRPFDDQSQARIRLETEATEHLLRAVEAGILFWVASDALFYENPQVSGGESAYSSPGPVCSCR